MASSSSSSFSSSPHAGKPKTNSSASLLARSRSQTVAISQQQPSSSIIKSKMPKLFLKTLKRQNSKPPIPNETNNINPNNNNSNKNRGKQGNSIHKKVNSFISIIFGNNRKSRDSGGSIDHHPRRRRGEEPPPPPTHRRKSSMSSKHKAEGEKEACVRGGSRGQSSTKGKRIDVARSSDNATENGSSGYGRGLIRRSVNLSKNSRVTVSFKKMERTNSMKRKGEGMEGSSRRESSGNGEEKICNELCKKKILMGEKCKPLNVSGSLQYDENGILVPEVII